jgi:hypothetical protein
VVGNMKIFEGAVSSGDPKTNSSFDLSLLICTRNRADQLAQSLKRVSAIIPNVGTQVPLSSYQTSGTEHNLAITGLPITDQPLIVFLQ